MRAPILVLLTLVAACGSSQPNLFDEGLDLEESEESEVASELRADELKVVSVDVDTAAGNHDGRVVRLLTTNAAAQALLGSSLPSISFSQNSLLAYRPDHKSPMSRVDVTRARVSSSGKTLTLWATITEQEQGCSPWKPNELSVVRVPKRTNAPTSFRVHLSRVTKSCGMTLGPVCVPQQTACPTATPYCHGSYERADGSFAEGRCVKFTPYSGTSSACSSDAECGAGGVGICAGLSTGQEGLCQAAWMRGTYSMPESGMYSAPLPRDGSWQRLAVTVRGQASVPMDAWVQLFVDGPSAAANKRVRYRLLNPAGTVSSESEFQGVQGAAAVMHVPGDEHINGEWVLEVRDSGTAGPPVRLRGARLSMTSRWD